METGLIWAPYVPIDRYSILNAVIKACQDIEATRFNNGIGELNNAIYINHLSTVAKYAKVQKDIQLNISNISRTQYTVKKVVHNPDGSILLQMT